MTTKKVELAELYAHEVVKEILGQSYPRALGSPAFVYRCIGQELIAAADQIERNDARIFSEAEL